jgi:hypothetical protein
VKKNDDIEDAFDEMVVEEMAIIEASRPAPKEEPKAADVDTLEQLMEEAKPAEPPVTSSPQDEVKSLEEVP